MPLAPWNKNYFEVSGNPTVSEATTFEVRVTGSNGSEQWYYRSLTGTGDYSAYNTAITLVVNTLLQLGSTGVFIKFTRTNATSYTPGDRWTFSTQKDVVLDESINQFDHIETIDVGDERNLLAISSSTGRVATIENIDTDLPTAVSSELNIGTGTEGHLLDFEKKNKELYVAKGRESNPQFLGYSKNNGFEGIGELELRSNPTLDTLEGASNPQTDAYEMSVMLRAGGGAKTKDARIIAGIKNVATSGDVKDAVYIQNLHTEKLYEYGTPTTPISIKRWYGKMHGSYCDGFAVLRASDKDPVVYGGAIDLWTMNTAAGGTVGQQANLYQTIQLKKPEGETTKIESFGDFYIVPQTSEFAKWFIVVSKSKQRRPSNSGNLKEDNWLWRTDDLTTAVIEGNDYEVQESHWDNIDPQLNNPASGATTKNGNEFYYMQKCNHAGPAKTTFLGSTQYGPVDMPDFVMVNTNHYPDTYHPFIAETSEYSCIMFAGFNSSTGSYGSSPYLSFTVRVAPSSTSIGNRNWYQANGCLQTVAQKQVNTGPSVAWSDNTGDPNAGSQWGWESEAFGPFMSNNAGSTHQINYRPVSWVTYMIEIKDANTGQGQYKAFPHMLDWAEQGSLASKWRTFKGNSNFSIPAWVTSIGFNGGEGELGKTSGTNVNLGIVKIEQVPSKAPNFGRTGRIVFSTTGTKRHRHLMHYVRPGSRRALTFRFGLESNVPQALNDRLNPTIFPNDWILSNQNINEPDYQNINAYANWSVDDNASLFPSNFYGTAANANNQRRFRNVSGTGFTGGGDKLGYRPAEGGNVTLDTAGSGTQWYPAENDDVMHLFVVKHGENQTKGRFKVPYTGSTSFSNLYTSSVSEFAIQTPVYNGVANSWAGISAKKVFYKASLIYDGYQETPLLSTPNSKFDTGGIDETINVEIRIKDTYPISERVTGVALYRATSDSALDLTEPETLYRFVEEIPLFQFNHNDVRGDQSFTVQDTGDAEGTYESINGVSEKIYDLGLNYTVNTQQNGYHFVSNCKHSQLPDAENFLFRSQPGKFAIFDWTKDFVELPFIPTSVIGFQGKVYCFSNNQTAIVNPENLYIEDVIEGVGCINSKTSLITDAGLVWCDFRNIYLASPGIQPIGSTMLNVDNIGWLNLSLEEKKDVRCGYDSKRKAFLFFFTKGTDHRCWAYSSQKRRWDLFETPERVMDTTLTKDGATILLLNNNKLAKFLANTTISKDWYWESKKINLSNTMVDKKIRNFKLEGNSRALTSIQYKLDGDTAWKTGVDIDIKFTGPNNKAYKLQTGDQSKKVHWIKLKIAGDNSAGGTDVKGYATSVIYKPKRPK